MVVIVGAGTTVTTNIITGGIVSVSFSVSPSVERLFELGEFDAYDIQIQTQESISLTNYGGASTPVLLEPSTSCDDSLARMNVEITPAPCTGGATPITRNGSDALFINSYSYSKEHQGYGQESWSLQGKPIIEGYTGNISFVQGFSEGQRLEGVDIVSDDGIVMTGSVTGSPYDAQARNLSVSAGSPGLGQDDIQTSGKIISIGGGKGREDGKRGTASANVPHQLIFY